MKMVQTDFLSEILALHSDIISHARTTLDKAIRIGELLTQQKESLKHGEWLPWVKSNLPFSHDTARNYMRVFSRRDEITKTSEFGLYDAYRLFAPTPAEGLLDEINPTRQTAPPQLTPQRLVDETFGEGTFDAVVSGEVSRQRVDLTRPVLDYSKPHVANNSGENEWYTPPRYIDAARSVMGEIDLDPASSEFANKTIKAKSFFTKEDDGLTKKWAGRVWMNPPYAQPLIANFAEKISVEFKSKRVKQACVLVNNATDTEWFHLMMQAASSVCFTKGRIRFIDQNGDPSGAPLQGQAILYFGNRGIQFKKEFKQFGFVL